MKNYRNLRFLTLPFFLISLILTSFLLSSPAAFASSTDYTPGEVVTHFKAKLNPETLRAGESARVEITATTKEGWHIYSVIHQGDDAPPPTSITYQKNPFSFDGPLYETKPIVKLDVAIGLTLAFHEGKAVFYQNFRIPTNISEGTHTIALTLTYQACNDRLCLPPTEVLFSFESEITTGSIRPEHKAPNRGIDLIPASSGLNKKQGLLGFLALAAFMGLASLLTPCVFPMVPITVSYFSKQAEGDHKRLIKLSSMFALGIIGTYTGTGLILAGLFGAGAAIQVATNPYVNLIIAGLFVIFAFSLMGLFEINLPQSWAAYFDNKSRHIGGVLGVLLMGFTFTLTAFTCTVQFVGTLLIAAASGEWLWPLLGMLVFSTVFAFPFFLLALSPGMIRKMQGKSGAWLGRSKVVLGILELMASIKFISNADLVWQTNLISRDFNIQLWMLFLAIIIIYLAYTAIRPKLNRSPLQWGIIVIFLGLFALTSQGLQDKSLGGLIDAVLPPTSGLESRLEGDFATKEEVESLRWHTDLDAALTIAKKEKKQIFLEFTGYTCVNCRWMEHHILARKQIHDRLKEMVLIRLYTDGGEEGPKNMEYQIARFKTVALPLYANLSPDNEILQQFIGISRSTEEFFDFVDLKANK